MGTHKVRKAVPEVTLCYGKSHLAHSFINGEKEAICLKTQKKKCRVSSLHPEMLVISAQFQHVEQGMSPTSEGTHLRISFSTILMNCSCHQGRNQPSGKASKGTLSQGRAAKS